MQLMNDPSGVGGGIMGNPNMSLDQQIAKLQ